MKRIMSIAAIALMVVGSSAFACDKCGCKANKADDKACCTAEKKCDKCTEKKACDACTAKKAEAKKAKAAAAE